MLNCRAEVLHGGTDAGTLSEQARKEQGYGLAKMV
jgi:hypothetical protein